MTLFVKVGHMVQQLSRMTHLGVVIAGVQIVFHLPSDSLRPIFLIRVLLRRAAFCHKISMEFNATCFSLLCFYHSYKFKRFVFSLQVKNIIYHAVKDALNSLKHYEREQSSTKGRMETDTLL